jgi:hypothetical protein
VSGGLPKERGRKTAEAARDGFPSLTTVTEHCGDCEGDS